MKYLLSIFLIIFSTHIQAQIPNTNNKQENRNKWARIGLLTSSIMFNAVGDGLYDEGNKLVAKSFRAASIGSLLVIPIASGSINKKKAFKYGLSYSLMRVGLFDITYNATRGLPLTYMGITSIYDRVVGGAPVPMMTMMRMTSIWISIELNNREVSK